MFSFDHSAEQAWEAISEEVEANKFKGNRASDWHVFTTEIKDGQDLGAITVVDCLLALEARIIKDRPLPTSGPVYQVGSNVPRDFSPIIQESTDHADEAKRIF